MKLEFIPVFDIPEITSGSDLPSVIRDAIDRNGLTLLSTDILALAQKVVSKAEGRLVRLEEIVASEESTIMASEGDKDPRFVEVVRQESARILRVHPRALITETHHGFVCANAGVDSSNVDGGNSVTLLPVDPDRSARRLFHSLGCGIIITDTFGRAWREGLVDVSIGLAGVPPFLDFRGQPDGAGLTLQATVLAAADALAAAAGLVMRKRSRIPAVLIRGFEWTPVTASSAASIVRRPDRDLFR